MTISRWFLIRMRNVLNESCIENQNVHFMFSIFLENCAVYEIMSNKCCKAREATEDNIMRCMRFACWIRLHARTHANTHKYVILSTATMCSRTRLNVTLHVHCHVCLSCNCHSFYVNNGPKMTQTCRNMSPCPNTKFHPILRSGLLKMETVCSCIKVVSLPDYPASHPRRNRYSILHSHTFGNIELYVSHFGEHLTK